MSGAEGQRENRLIHETSPYLLQHARNPVDWYPWGPEALALAQQRDQPILLSVGYAACHWCHVMERESFENEAIAGVMNRHFVCVKVDREERPDLDDIYMAATVGMSGAGGWPMTVFLTPDQKPFFAGTYFPPESRWGRPGFATLLERIAELWQTEREELSEQARRITLELQRQHESQEPFPIGRVALETFVDELGQSFDPRLGGFGQAPKFPPKAALSLLLRYHAKTADSDALGMVTTTLDAMKNGGLYDHAAGGFARYSTDERWLVPHFEKMLYDNAELAVVYLEAYQVTRDPEYARVARETLDYLAREMQGARGGFFSSTDADSEGVEGKFFVWTVEQVNELLDERDAECFCAYYDVTREGNWEGTNILNTPRPMSSVAGDLGVPLDELAERIARARRLVYEARERREHPSLDDKILTAHNGLAIHAMSTGYLVLGDDRYLHSATRAADYVLQALRRPDQGLFRTARGDQAHLDAYLEDYAYLGDALISLYEVGGVPRFLSAALKLAERMVQDFSDPEGSGAFFHTALDHEPLIVRPREGHDSALPNPNSMAARALARLGHHFGRQDLVGRARTALTAYGAGISRLPRAFASALSVVDFLVEGPIGLVLVGKPDELTAHRAMLARRYIPNRTLAFVDPTSESSRQASQLTADKTAIEGRPTVYLCEDFACRAPETDLGRLEQELESALVRRRSEARDELSHPI